MGGPDMDSNICMACENGDMYNAMGYHGRFIAG